MPTEKEASAMWCPFVRHCFDDGVGGSFNRGDGSDQLKLSTKPGSNYSCNCLGSRCMAWRWSRKTPVDSPIGYCGLAGQGYHP